MEDFFKYTDELMKKDWKLRWFYRWEYFKLEISEFWWKIKTYGKETD